MTAATRLRSRHLLGIADLDPAEIELVLDTAVAMKEIGTRTIKKVPALRGRTVVNLFFEASTRTRLSFELAEKRLSADTMGITTAGSSVTKGETLAAVDIIEWFADESRRVYGRIVPPRNMAVQQQVWKEPVGPVAAFTPWNFPALTPMRKIAASIASGCSCISLSMKCS